MSDARWTDLAAAEYHKDPAVSRSALVDLMTLGVVEYHARHVTEEIRFDGNDATELGNVVHDIALRGMDKTKLCVQIPESALSSSGSRAGGAWKAFKADCDAAGVLPLRDKDWFAVDRMLNAIQMNDSAMRIINKTEFKERTCEWRDDETGLMCRVMFDLYAKRFRAYLKTTRKVLQPFTIADHIAKMGYHWQVAFYQRAAKELGADDGPFVFIFVKNEPPYTCRCYQIPDEQIAISDAQIGRHLLMLRDHVESDVWKPSDDGKVTEVRLPRWIENLDQWMLPEPAQS